MGRHAAHDPAPAPRRRPGSDLLGWATFTAALTAAALLWFGVPLATAVAVPALVLAAFGVVWVAAWSASGRAATREDEDTPPDDDAPASGRTDGPHG